MPILFYSVQDAAGTNTANALRSLRSYREFHLLDHAAWRFDCFDLVELHGPTVEAQVADSFGSDLAVFLSRHKSSSGKKCFTTHATGNFGDANHGGAQKTLCKTSAFWLKRFFLSLKEKTGNAFFEATHHGPTLDTPSLFVEIGSDETEWQKKENGVLLAESVLAAFTRKDVGKVALGFGGTHYCSAFMPLIENGWAFSHVASKHSLDFVTKDLVRQAFEKTVEQVDAVLLDKKGCRKEQKEKIASFCDSLGCSWESL